MYSNPCLVDGYRYTARILGPSCGPGTSWWDDREFKNPEPSPSESGGLPDPPPSGNETGDR